MIKVLHICQKCNKEYKLPINEGIFCFGPCPHCGARNDVWIKVVLTSKVEPVDNQLANPYFFEITLTREELEELKRETTIG